MKRIILSKITSWLYRKDYMNPARTEIYSAMQQNSHPQSDIKTNFSDKTQKVVQSVKAKIEKAEKARDKELAKLRKRRK